MTMLTRTQGQLFRDEGMERSLQHADQVEPGWSDQALAEVRRMATDRHEFTGEHVADVARARGVPEPIERRAWGQVMATAARRGWIEPTGVFETSRHAQAHCRPVRVWRSKLR